MQSDCCILTAESYLLITEISACIAEHYYINIWAVCGAPFFTFSLRHCMRVCIYIVNEYRDRFCTSQTSSSINIAMCEMITTWTFYQNRNHRWDITRQVTQVNFLSEVVNKPLMFETSYTSWMICLINCTCVNQLVRWSRVKQYIGSAEPSPWV